MQLINFDKLNRKNKIYILLFVDFFLILLSFFLNYYFNFNNLQFIFITQIYIILLINFFIIFSLFYIFRVHQTLVRSFDMDHIFKLLLIIILANFLSYFISSYFKLNFDLNFYINQILLIFVLIISSRYLMLIILNQNNRQNLERLAIYGAGSAGQSLLDNIASLKKYKIYLFVDDDQNKVGMKISKYPIVSRHEFLKTYKLKNIKLLIIAIPSLSNYQKKLLLENLSDCNIEVKFLPSLDQILSNKYSITDLRNIRFDDFFLKKNNFQNNLMMEKFYKEKTILLTGAGGSIGSVIFKKLILFKPKHIILVDKSELNLFNITKYFADSNLNIKITTCLFDLLNSNKLKNIFKIYSIDHVIHAAAYKHVSIVENNKGYALYNNLISTFNLVEQSLTSKVQSVTLISSDKSVNPTTFMGMTKLVCEIFFKYMGSKHTELKKKLNIVRFGNVFHSSGSVVEIFKKQIENQGPITISNKKATRFFMSIDNACELVLSSLVISNSNNLTNTYVLDMGKPINILDLAKKISKFYGKELVEKKTNQNNPNEIEYIITGLTKGEKIQEELSYSKLYKSELKDILIDSYEIKNYEKIEIFFDKLSKYIRNYEINDAENLVIKLSKNIDEYIIYKK